MKTSIPWIVSVGLLCLLGCITPATAPSATARPTEAAPSRAPAPAAATSAPAQTKPAVPHPEFARQLQGKKVAVVVYSQNTASRAYDKTALTRMESILADNSITVLDKNRAAELKDVFRKLDDPGAFVTAEDFVANAGKFDIDGLVAVYLRGDVRPGLASYFTATAAADIRFISEASAAVRAFTTTPMGVPGMPPSDGLTESSAMMNAVQRAADNAAMSLGLSVADPVTPNSVQLRLEAAPPPATIRRTPRAADAAPDAARFAKLDTETWRKEKVTQSVRAPGGGLAAVAGYIQDTDFQRHPPRLFGSRIHVVDESQSRALLVLDCHSVEKKTSSQRGTVKILDLMFMGNWRYLAAVTGSALFLWDVERGRLMESIELTDAPAMASLNVGTDGEATYLLLDLDSRGARAFRIVRK
jgi:hypothetical protein